MVANSFGIATVMDVRDSEDDLKALLDALPGAARAPACTNGDAGTQQLAVRCVVYLPTNWAAAAVLQGSYTFAEFFHAFIHPIAAANRADYE